MRPITFAKFTVGDGFTATVEVRNPQTKTLVDPDDIVLRLLDPLNVETAITPVRLDTGIYEASGVFDSPGTWYRQWKVTGSTEGVEEDAIVVEPSHFT
jgi:hypothetical protein